MPAFKEREVFVVHAEASPVSPRRAVRAMLPGLTLARVLAMGLILVGHSSISYTWSRDRSVIWPVFEADGWAPLDFLTLQVRGIALPCFFLLAGISAGWAASTTSAKRFAFGRLRSLGGPLVVALLTVLPLTLGVYLYAMQVTARANMSPAQLVFVEQLADRPLLWGPIHLWFLEMLLLVSCGYALLVWAGRKLERVGRATGALRDAARRALASRWRTLVFAAPLLAIYLIDLRPWEVLFHAFLPQPLTLVYYAAFFAAGVCISRLPQPRETLGRNCWLELFVAAAGYAAMYPLAWRHFAEPLQAPSRGLLLVLIAVTTAASLLALVGLCVRYVRSANPVVQYLAQASFWMYLVHVPIVMLLQMELWRYDLPTPLKFFVVCGGSLGLSLATYELVVRPGWLGKRLAGRQDVASTSGGVVIARRIAGVSIAAALAVVLGYGGWLAAQRNLHRIAGSDVYRSARLPTSHLKRLIADERIEHLVVVCDASADHGWFAEQQQLCDTHRVTTNIVALPSREPPSPAALAALVHALQQTSGPVLIEGKTGNNREAVAAAVAELLAGRSPAAAKRQFSWRYGYLHAHAAKGPHVFLADYEAWLLQQHRSHSPQQFVHWIAATSAIAVSAEPNSSRR